MGAPESGLEIDSLFAHNRTKVPEHPGVPAHDQVCDDPYDGCEPREPIKTLKNGKNMKWWLPVSIRELKRRSDEYYPFNIRTVIFS